MAYLQETQTDPAGLVAQANQLIADALRLYRRPDAYARLARFTTDQSSIDWGTVWGSHHTESTQVTQPPETPFPVLLRTVEALARQIEALQVVLTSFSVNAYSSEVERVEVFGMPSGKAAFRNIAEYLRDTLRISLRSSKARVKRAHALAPAPSLDGGHVPASRYPDVVDKFFGAAIDATAADIVIDTIDDVERAATEARVLTPQVQDQLSAGQAQLAEQASELDPDGLRQVAKRWSEYTTYWFNQDGTPDDEILDRKRGAFYRGRSYGLHNWVLRVDELFHERLRVLASVVNNPHTGFVALKTLLEQLFGTDLPSFVAPAVRTHAKEPDQQALFSEDELGQPITAADERTREQKLLDGMTAVFDTGMSLASTTFPTTSGQPPQLSVLMDYQTLYEQFTHDCPVTGTARPSATNFISQALFTGPISPSTIRRLSCEADLIPAVLSSNGAILDIGRKARLFTVDQRRALIIRDRGCAAPNCTIPAPWCDAHHVDPWREGGATAITNAVLLCSHHHHAVHAGLWTVTMQNGIAWFIPAPYLDPDQRPRRNRYWR